jgi:TRAP-type mannitol/chloroaromatic compound transport system permease large subunit
MSITTLKKKLENPFALIAQGFVVGLILFGVTMPRESSAHDADQAIAAAIDSQR